MGVYGDSKKILLQGKFVTMIIHGQWYLLIGYGIAVPKLWAFGLLIGLGSFGIMHLPLLWEELSFLLQDKMLIEELSCK